MDGLVLKIQRTYQHDVFQASFFVSCNRARDKIKIIHWENGFWLYDRRLEVEHFKWPSSQNQTIAIDYKELEAIVLKDTLSEKDTKDQTMKGIHHSNEVQEVWTE